MKTSIVRDNISYAQKRMNMCHCKQDNLKGFRFSQCIVLVDLVMTAKCIDLIVEASDPVPPFHYSTIVSASSSSTNSFNLARICFSCYECHYLLR